MIEAFREQIEQAGASNTPLNITGSNSKTFYGRETTGKPLDVSGYSGIIEYEPSELVMTARAGTTLAELETVLDQADQCLPFEPPHFGPNATLGGTLACGFSGPKRPFVNAGGSSARDLVLGCTIINGKAEILEFGGQVMKNVAGYDVSRLMVGAMGTLGLILQASLKVLPKPEQERTLIYSTSQAQAIENINRWMGQPLPISAASWHHGQLHIRLSGSDAGVAAAAKQLGGEDGADSRGYWRSIRELQQSFFSQSDRPLWRLSLSGNAAPLDLEADCLLDWGGAQRWYRTDMDAQEIRRKAEQAGGSATLFRADTHAEQPFHPLKPGIAKLHQNLKQAFDPQAILNPGRMYPEL